MADVVRTISVKLTMQITGYLGNAEKAAAVTKELAGNVAALGAELEKLNKTAPASADGIGKVRTSVKGLSDDVGKLGAGGATKLKSLEDGAKRLDPPVTKVRFSLKGLMSDLDKMATTSKEKFSRITTGIAVFGAALLAPFALAAHSAADFDHEMSAVASVTSHVGLTSKQAAAQIDSLRTAAMKAGKDTVFSATQAAQAEEELVKAGVSANDILGGGLTGSLSLASAGSLSLADAATDAAQALNIFHLQGAAVPHIADVLTAAANESATDVGKLAQSLNQAGLIASQTGLSLEDTAGTLALFAQNGLAGSDAGTSLKTMLQALQSPSKITKSLMDQLGISAYNSQGSFKGITGLADNLRASLGGLTQAQRDAALAQIFGSDAVRAADLLYKTGGTDLQNWITNVNQAGIANETAGKKMDNLSGDIEQLKGSVETLAISAGSGANQGLRILTQGVTGVVNSFLGLPGPVQAGITVLSGVSGVALLATSGFLKVRGTVKDFMATLRDSGGASEAFANNLGKVGTVLGKAGLWGAGALLAYEGIKTLAGWIDGHADVLVVNVDKMTTALTEFAGSGKVTGEMARVFGSDLSGIAKDVGAIQQAHVEIAKIQNAPLGIGSRGRGMAEQQVAATEDDPKAAIAGTDAALANLITNGQSVAAATSFDRVADSMASMGMSFDQINAMFPQYTKAEQAATIANSAMANGFADTDESAKTMNDTLSAAITKFGSLDASWKALNGANVGVKQTAIAVEQGIDDLATSLDKSSKAAIRGGKAFDINTQAGRDNNTAILEIVSNAADAAQAMYVQTGSVDTASATYDTYIAKLKATLKAAGATDTQIQALTGSIDQMPPLKAIPITTPGVDTAIDKVSTLVTKISGLHGKTVTVTVLQHNGVYTDLHTGQQFERWGGITRHAADGLISLREAATYSAGNPIRYGFAERETGGEGFVPKNGNYQRSTSIIDTEARWYGGRFVPNYAMGSGKATLQGQSISTTYNVYPQRASFSTQDLAALTARHDAETRVGRRR